MKHGNIAFLVYNDNKVEQMLYVYNFNSNNPFCYFNKLMFQDSRRDRTKQLLSERIDTSNVYQTIGAVEERSRSPAKSILKKSSTNPDLLSEVKARSSPNSPTRDLSPSREPSPRIGEISKHTTKLLQLYMR